MDLDWAFWVSSAILALLGAWIATRALFKDRSRGRRRCPKCWYEMTGVPGLTCPECGHAAATERHLLRTRRRWPIVALALLLFALSLGVWITPGLMKHGAKGLPLWMLTLADTFHRIDALGDAVTDRMQLGPGNVNAVDKFFIRRFGRSRLLKPDSTSGYSLSRVWLSKSLDGYQAFLFSSPSISDQLTTFESALTVKGHPARGHIIDHVITTVSALPDYHIQVLKLCDSIDPGLRYAVASRLFAVPGSPSNLQRAMFLKLSRDSSPDVRRAACLAVHRDPELRRLLWRDAEPLIGGGSESDAALAASILILAGPDARRSLERWLENPNPMSRATVLGAMVSFNDLSTFAVDRIPAIVRDDPSDQCRLHAIRAVLQQSAFARDRESIIRRAIESDPSAPVRAQVAYYLAHDPSLVIRAELLTARLFDESPLVREAAVRAFQVAGLWSPDIRARVAAALTDSSESVRAAAKATLEQMAAVRPAETPAP